MSEKEDLGLIDRFVAAMRENERENRETISKMGQPFGPEAFDFAMGLGGGGIGSLRGGLIKQPEALKAAAIRVGKEVYADASHAMAYMKARDALGDAAVSKALGNTPRDFQGFVTTTGRFVTRKEAVAIADKAKQLDLGRRRPEKMGIEHMKSEEFSRMSRKLKKE